MLSVPISNHKSNIHLFWSSHSFAHLTFSNAFQWSVFFFSGEFTPKKKPQFPHHPVKVQSGDKFINYWLVLPCRCIHSFISISCFVPQHSFHFIRSCIRTSTPHCKQFIHSITLRYATFTTFRPPALVTFHSFTAHNSSTLSSGIYLPPAKYSPRNFKIQIELL